MSKNSVQPGNIVDLPAPAGGISSGEAALINGLFGVAQKNIADGKEGPYAVEGVHTLPLDNTVATTKGARLYWDAGNSQLTTNAAAGANKEVGTAASAEQVGATTVECLLGVRVGA